MSIKYEKDPNTVRVYESMICRDERFVGQHHVEIMDRTMSQPYGSHMYDVTSEPPKHCHTKRLEIISFHKMVNGEKLSRYIAVDDEIQKELGYEFSVIKRQLEDQSESIFVIHEELNKYMFLLNLETRFTKKIASLNWYERILFLILGRKWLIAIDKNIKNKNKAPGC